jgi:lipocalin
MASKGLIPIYWNAVPTNSNLWILARGPHMEEPLKSELIKKVESLGFEPDKTVARNESLCPFGAAG